MRILVVEDNRSLVANLFDYFEGLGHTLDAAPDGPTGFHLASTQHYDAIVLDWMLPRLDGREVLRRLRNEANCNVPVLMPWLMPGWIRRLRRRDARLILLLGWSALVFLFFSASPGKREVYLFPALPAMCLAAAPLLPGLLRRRRDVQSVLLVYLLVISVVLVGLGISGVLGTGGWAQRLAEGRALPPSAAQMVLWSVIALGIAGVALAAWGKMRRSAIAVTLFTGVMWLIYGLGIAPALDGSSSARGLMQSVDARVGPGSELGMVAWREQLLLQADRPAVEFGFKQPWHVQWREAQVWLSEAPERRWLLVLDEALSACVRKSDVVPIGRANRRNWLLVPGTALIPECETVPFGAHPEPE